MLESDGSPKEARRDDSTPGYPRVRTAHIGLGGTRRLRGRVYANQMVIGSWVASFRSRDGGWRMEEGR